METKYTDNEKVEDQLSRPMILYKSPAKVEGEEDKALGERVWQDIHLLTKVLLDCIYDSSQHIKRLLRMMGQVNWVGRE